MNARLRTSLLCCVLTGGSAWLWADAEPPVTASEELARHPVINEAKLDDMRGGLSIAGLDYTVGAVMRTLVDGSVVLESAVDLHNMTGVNVADTFMLQDTKGITRVAHDLNKDRIVATVVNQADQRAIQVELDINVTLQNYGAWQAAAVRNRILNSLGGTLRD